MAATAVRLRDGRKCWHVLKGSFLSRRPCVAVDCREDAVATLDLYLRYIACDPQLMAEEELMRHYLVGILRNTHA